MVEREHQPALTLFADDPLTAGETISLDDDAIHHARVRRVAEGETLKLANGRGATAVARIEKFGKYELLVAIQSVRTSDRPVRLELFVPVADRDRMLLAAEKCVELQATVWQPVYYARSRSVAGRGEGDKFRAKVQARMRSALEQSGAAWLPDVRPEAELRDIVQSSFDGARLCLEMSGNPLASQPFEGSTRIAVGPEGGFDPAELELFREHGWTVASLGNTVLRFETAVIAAAAVVRAAQQAGSRSSSSIKR